MNNKPWYVIVGTFLGILAVFIAIALFLYRVRGILPPFVIAFAIAFLLDPLLERLQHHGVPRIVAVTTVFAIFMTIFAVAVIFLVPAVIEQTGQLGKDYPIYAESFKSATTDFLDKHHVLLTRFELPTTLQELVAKYGNIANDKLKTGVPQVVNWVVGSLSYLPWIILIPLISFYFLSDYARIRKKTMLFIPERYREETAKVLSRMGTVFSSYVRGLTVVCIAYGVAITLLLLVLHLKYAIIIGMIAGILYAVPYLGSITTALLVFLVGIATYPGGVMPAVITTIFAICSNQFFDFFITPKVLGKSVGLHPILSLFAMLAGGTLFSLAGMILAVPIAASIQEIVFEFYPELREDPLVEVEKKPNILSKYKKTAKKSSK